MFYGFKQRWFGSMFACVVGAIAAAQALASEDARHRPAPPRMSDVEIAFDLRRQLAQAAADGRFSGTVLFARHGYPLLAEAYGPANRAFGARNRLDTRFNLASAAKMYTTTAILQLVGERRLSLDDTLLSVLPDYPNRQVAGSVTIAQLLAMTSGLGDYANAAFGRTNWLHLRRIEDYLRYFVDDPLRFAPGSREGYSNAGYLVLGLVVERVSGQRFNDYVASRIFAVADMEDSGYFTSEDDVPNLAVGYTNAAASDAPASVALRLGRGAEAAGGSGTYGTVRDLLRFADAIAAGRLLPPEFTDRLMRGSPFAFRHELGWQHDDALGIYSFGHGGDFNGTSADLVIYPTLGYTVAVLSNYDGAAHLASSRIRYRLSGLPQPRAIALPPAALQRYAGTYRTTPGGPGAIAETVHIAVERGALSVKVPRQGLHKFVPLSATEFFDDDMLSPRLVFTTDASGAVVGLALSGIGRDIVAAPQR